MIRPTKSEDWEPYRETIRNLYNTMKLKDVMAEMQAVHHFKATEKQYKTQLKKWNLDTKYIKASEYIAMIKTKREREKENPPKETRFILRGRVVDPKDITRFEKRALKKGKLQLDEEEEDQEPVEDLLYDTPPPEETTKHLHRMTPHNMQPRNTQPRSTQQRSTTRLNTLPLSMTHPSTMLGMTTQNTSTPTEPDASV